MMDIEHSLNKSLVLASQIADSSNSVISFGVSNAGGIQTWDSGEQKLHFIASSSKLFTFACFAKLQENGSLDLDEAVNRFLSKDLLSQVCHTKTDLDSLSINQLLNHTSGIPDYYQAKKLKKGNIESQTKNDPGWGFDEVVELSSGMKKKPAPTSRAIYSGTNYQLLEQILKTLFSSYEQALTELITQPLGLAETFVFRNEHITTLKTIQPLKYGEEAYSGYPRMASLGAEGGIVSSAEETLRFCDALFGGEFLGKKATDRWLSQSNPFRAGIRYGQGLMFFRSKLVFGSDNLVGHMGASSHIAAYNQGTKTSFVVTVNDFAGHRNSLRILKSLNQPKRKAT